MKNLSILGCTGSIGDTTFNVLENLSADFRVCALSGGNQVDKLIERARRWQPDQVWVGDAKRWREVRQALPSTIEVSSGAAELAALAALEQADLVVNGLVGAVGLEPTLAAVGAGKVVAMANKEPLVMAGGLILQQARATGATILPLDSEPNALWQCLKGEPSRALERIILTASGGAFRDASLQTMAKVTPQQALAHPTWKMGPKITVDSATLMNKGFEVLEASWLFDLAIEQIEVVIHRESIVHSMVELVDGAILAHLGLTDMALPIQYALTHPERSPSPLPRLDLTAVGHLSFSAPDRDRFPCLDLCYAAGKRGGTAPTVLNGANEEGVAAFLSGKIGFCDIAVLNAWILDHCTVEPIDGAETVLNADSWSRNKALEWIETV